MLLEKGTRIQLRQKTFSELVRVKGLGWESSQYGHPTSTTQGAGSQIFDACGCTSREVSQVFYGEVYGT